MGNKMEYIWCRKMDEPQGGKSTGVALDRFQWENLVQFFFFRVKDSKHSVLLRASFYCFSDKNSVTLELEITPKLLVVTETAYNSNRQKSGALPLFPPSFSLSHLPQSIRPCILLLSDLFRHVHKYRCGSFTRVFPHLRFHYRRQNCLNNFLWEVYRYSRSKKTKFYPQNMARPLKFPFKLNKTDHIVSCLDQSVRYTGHQLDVTESNGSRVNENVEGTCDQRKEQKQVEHGSH